MTYLNRRRTVNIGYSFYRNISIDAPVFPAPDVPEDWKLVKVVVKFHALTFHYRVPPALIDNIADIV